MSNETKFLNQNLLNAVLSSEKTVLGHSCEKSKHIYIPCFVAYSIVILLYHLSLVFLKIYVHSSLLLTAFYTTPTMGQSDIVNLRTRLFPSQ